MYSQTCKSQTENACRAWHYYHSQQEWHHESWLQRTFSNFSFKFFWNINFFTDLLDLMCAQSPILQLEHWTVSISQFPSKLHQPSAPVQESLLHLAIQGEGLAHAYISVYRWVGLAHAYITVYRWVGLSRVYISVYRWVGLARVYISVYQWVGLARVYISVYRWVGLAFVYISVNRWVGLARVYISVYQWVGLACVYISVY